MTIKFIKFGNKAGIIEPDNYIVEIKGCNPGDPSNGTCLAPDDEDYPTDIVEITEQEYEEF